jgi:hypothetical protein
MTARTRIRDEAVGVLAGLGPWLLLAIVAVLGTLR